MSFNFSIPSGLGLTTVAAYTTAAVGTTRAVGVVAATTISDAATTLAPVGFGTTALFQAHTTSHARIVADITQIKQVLNSIVGDFKTWELSS